MSFRIAIGRCDCRKPYRDAIQEKVCEAIANQLTRWRTRLPGDLEALPKESFGDQHIDGHRVTFGTYKVPVSTGDTLVVFQALVHTWSRPTFFAIGAVGRMYAEGLLVAPNGEVQIAPDQLLWHFR